MSTANSNSSPSALPPVIHFSSSTIPANYPESAIRSTVNLNFPASSNALRTTERGLAQKNNQPRDQHSHLRHVDSKPNNSPRNAPSERVPPPTWTPINPTTDIANQHVTQSHDRPQDVPIHYGRSQQFPPPPRGPENFPHPHDRPQDVPLPHGRSQDVPPPHSRSQDSLYPSGRFQGVPPPPGRLEGAPATLEGQQSVSGPPNQHHYSLPIAAQYRFPPPVGGQNHSVPYPGSQLYPRYEQHPGSFGYTLPSDEADEAGIARPRQSRTPEDLQLLQSIWKEGYNRGYLDYLTATELREIAAKNVRDSHGNLVSRDHAGGGFTRVLTAELEILGNISNPGHPFQIGLSIGKSAMWTILCRCKNRADLDHAPFDLDWKVSHITPMNHFPPGDDLWKGIHQGCLWAVSQFPGLGRGDMQGFAEMFRRQEVQTGNNLLF